MDILLEVVTAFALLLQAFEDPFLFIALISLCALVLGIFNRNYAVSFFVTIGLTFGVTHSIKSLFKIARPEDALVVANGYRFPSMHAALGAALLTSCAWYLCTRIPSLSVRISIILITAISIICIGWTRIFLGVHETIDVVTGIILGTSISLLLHGGMHLFHLDTDR